MKRYINNAYTNIVAWMLILTAGAMLTGCHDDTFDSYNVVYPEGNTLVNLNIDFEPLTNTRLTGRSNAPDGDVVKDLTDFSILFYDTRGSENGSTGKLTYCRHFSAAEVANPTPGNTDGITSVTMQTRKNGDASNGQNIAEAQTKRVELKLKDVPYGPYKIYAVANLGVNGKTTREVLENADISSPEALSSMKAEWDRTNMLNNAQMTGYFSEGEQTPSPGTGSAVDIVKINQPNMKIHSWLRRLVSKVTIDYDPTNLRKSVTVTIKKVTIRDVASSCYLGLPNKIGPVDGDGVINTDELVSGADASDGNHYIDYGETGLVLTSATEGYPQSPDFKGAPHREQDRALFFFENMQGEVPDKDINGKLQDGKLQDGNGDGIIDHPDGWKPEATDYKDGLRYGTYIEVEAEYDAKSVGHIGHGSIKYRFMIGKNVTTNCDAERNHHYKLKLCFIGNANEVDWHIEYDETPGFYGPNPYYVSYSYNRMTYYPLRISGELEGDVKLTIYQNAWWPNNAVGYDYYGYTDKDAKGNKLKNDEGQDSAGIDMSKLYCPDKTYPLQPWTGFLSLAQDMSLENTNVAGELRMLSGYDQYKPYLYQYWTGTNNPSIDKETKYDDTGLKRGVRSYSSTTGLHDEDRGGDYTVTKDETSTTINVPFFTREKQLQKRTAYTGNNPYKSYWREAKMYIEYKLKGEDKARKDSIKVYQVQRIVNPKGVWRSHDKATGFHVNLKYQESEMNPTFKSLKSIGPWRAYISRGNTSFISLNGKNEVRGGDDTEIDFHIAFNGTIKETENRCAVIRVEYNNYSCHHLIFVRQGSAPIQMNANSTTKWHLANVSTTDSTSAITKPTVSEGASPLDEGSLFRFGNLSVGISSLSNPPYAKEINGELLDDSDFDPSYNDNPSFDYVSTSSKKKVTKWNEITFLKNTESFPDVTLNNKTCRVATSDDFQSIMSGSDKTSMMENGYGVLYGNEATETATTVEMAYGYCPADGKTKGYGMRGVFVYNASTSVATLGGNHVFFPIGRSGYGRRKVHNTSAKAFYGHNYNKSVGVLQYAGRGKWYKDTEPDDVKYLPLFNDIFRSHGALYWMKNRLYIASNNIKYTADINYHTLDFNLSDLGYNLSTCDACFVRLVED